MNIAVLGCGPAGLMAADVCSFDESHDVDIISIKRKSIIAGAQFMHAKTGWYCSETPDFQVDVIKQGTAEGYAENVYGTTTAKTSWSRFIPGTIYGWDMKLAYERLWTKWENEVTDEEMSHNLIMACLGSYDKVISTVPLPSICYNSEHSFINQVVHIVHGPADETHQKSGDIMYYNGHTDGSGLYNDGVIGFSWYRFSQLGGHQAWEYADHRATREQLETNCHSGQEVTTVRKAVGSNCDCYDGLIKVGRYGTYDKSVLTHHVREQVLNALQSV